MITSLVAINEMNSVREVTPRFAGLRIVLQGRVQGVGVRPAIARLAKELRLAGVVKNTNQGVVIEVEGNPTSVTHFARKLTRQLPAEAVLEEIRSESFEPKSRTEFVIATDQALGPLVAQVPPDRVICRDCLDEVHDPASRRYRYPFTSCTRCGPRYSLIEQLPYERRNTSMRKFTMCEECARECEDVEGRRGHSQINACPQCGPQVWWSDGQNKLVDDPNEALQQAIAAIRAGKIVAIRGVDGYQLLVDATDTEAVSRLRQRKHRPAKPLAVLVESLAAAEALAEISLAERKALTAASNPIVLLAAKRDNGLAETVSPDLNTIGLLLSSTALHDLIVHGAGRPLVCTSGNVDGEPLQFEAAKAETELASISDGFLHHSRDITHPIDDSVVRVIANRPVTIRLARGLAPLGLALPTHDPQLAVGGQMKGAMAWSNGQQSVLGPHLGDQTTLAARLRFQQQQDGSCQLYRFKPKQLVHDHHPEYATTLWAEQQNLSIISVQHHHAHVVAGMIEQGWLDKQVLGVAWDGTGWGPDAIIWGGEFLLATATKFERFARLRPFALPGGEQAIHQPWRAALAVAAQIGASDSLLSLPLMPNDTALVRNVEALLEQPQLSPITSSAGRLFDAAAAIILGVGESRYEGELAMRLESVADRRVAGFYPLPLTPGKVWELDWRPMFHHLLVDLARGTTPGELAMRFHRSLAIAIRSVCLMHPRLSVVLGGGVFQNRLLTELVVELWGKSSQPLGLPGVIPPNDGGLAAGQLAIACCLSRKE